MKESPHHGKTIPLADLKIIKDSSETLSKDSAAFGAIVKGDTLVVPVAVEQVLRRYKIFYASSFLTHLRAIPEALALDLVLSRQALDQKKEQLLGVLRGHVDPELLAPPAMREFKFGTRRK